MGSLVAELAEKLSSATNNLDFDEQTLFLNTSADTVGIGTNSPGAKLDVWGSAIFNEMVQMQIFVLRVIVKLIYFF